MSQNPAYLLFDRRYWPLFWTQFFGAFNDNLFKSALAMFITFKVTTMWGLTSGALVNATAGIFILPFFIFSATAGQMADKFSKHGLIRKVKVLEITIMSLALVGFHHQWIGPLLVVLFAMGLQSALFGPLKYGVIPELLASDDLMPANAVIEAGTFLAILLGTICGGILMMYPKGPWLIGTSVVVVAVAGWCASLFIPYTKPAAAKLHIHWNLVSETWRVMRDAAKETRPWQSIIAISWFWLVGALFLAQFPALAKDVLHGDEGVVTLLLAAFSVGIGGGSLLCNKLTHGHPSTKYVAFGGLGLSIMTFIFCASLQLVPPQHDVLSFTQFLGQTWSYLPLLALVGISVAGGVYIVPLYVVLQHEAAPGHKARVIAANNIVNALFMVISAVTAIGLLSAGVSVVELLALTGIANLAVTYWVKKIF